MLIWAEMDYSDLQFHNIQLMKLVSSAEILFQNLYEMVSAENKALISQWLCGKEEYDGDSNSQLDDDNIQESFASMAIAEVSDKEEPSSVSSVSTSLSVSSLSSENETNMNDAAASKNDDHTDSVDMSTLFSSTENPASPVDADLLEYMPAFQLYTDSSMSDWIKTRSFNSSEVKEFLTWLENKGYERIWDDIHNDPHSEPTGRKCTENESVMRVRDSHFIPVETTRSRKQLTDYAYQRRKNSAQNPSNANLCADDVDQPIRYLQEIRHRLMHVRENLNAHSKKEELKSRINLRKFLKVDVAFEIIDLSIEMKNQFKLGHDIENLTVKDEIDTIIANCLSVLSLNEIRHLLSTFLANVVEVLKCSSKNDKLIRKLETEISDIKLKIWDLWKRHMILRKEYKQKLHPMRTALIDESTDESIVGAPRATKATPPAVSCIPEKSLKQLRKTISSSSGLKVTRIARKKLIIQTQKG